MSKRVVVYPGFFDPFTLGHQNVVERGTRMFDNVVVAVAVDSPKTSLLSGDERVDIIKEVFADHPKVAIDRFDGLLVQYLKNKGYHAILRGLRTVSDFEYEYQMALANKTLAKDIETLFMVTEGPYSYLSSTLIKEIARLGGDLEQMLPKEAIERVRRKYAAK